MTITKKKWWHTNMIGLKTWRSFLNREISYTPESKEDIGSLKEDNSDANSKEVIFMEFVEDEYS